MIHHKLVAASAEEEAGGSEPLWVNIDGGKTSSDMPAKDSALVLKTASEKRTGARKLNDGCFTGDSWTSNRALKVLDVTKRISEMFEIKKGETIHMSCYGYFSSPDGADCPK